MESWCVLLSSGSSTFASFMSEGLPFFANMLRFPPPLGNSVIMADLQNEQQNDSCFRRKRVQVVYPIDSFSCRQLRFKKGTATSYATQPFPNIERNLSLMVHFVEKGLFRVVAGSIALMGLGFSSCRYPGRRRIVGLLRMTPRSAWQESSYFCCLNDSKSLMSLTDQTLITDPLSQNTVLLPL